MGMRFFFGRRRGGEGVMKMFQNLLWWRLYYSVNRLKVIELYILNGWIVWHMNYLLRNDFQIMMLEMIGKFGGKNQIVFLTVPLKIHILWIKNLNIKMENIRKNYWKMVMILGARKILLKKIQILKNL